MHFEFLVNLLLSENEMIFSLGRLGFSWGGLVIDFMYLRERMGEVGNGKERGREGVVSSTSENECPCRFVTNGVRCK